MSIDLQSESLLSLQQSRTAFPGGKRLSLATLHRWRLKGVRGTRLETILIGGQRYTSTEAIERFIAAQNAKLRPHSVRWPMPESDELSMQQASRHAPTRLQRHSC